MWNQDVQYAVFQREQCPTTGRLHWQGYVQFKRTRTQRQCKEVLGRGSHVLLSRGTPEENEVYCTKEDTRVAGPFRFGQRVDGDQRGRRTDIAEAAAAIRDGGDRALRDLIRTSPELFVRYWRGFDALISRVIPPRDSNDTPDVRVYHGLSGSGKSRSVHEEFGADQIYQKNGSNKWWCGYTGQKCILFDDFAGSMEIPPVELLRICDRYAHGVETKGGRVVMGKATVIFTTMIHWSLWYRASDEWQTQRPAFERRVRIFRSYPLAVDDVSVADVPERLDPVVEEGLDGGAGGSLVREEDA